VDLFDRAIVAEPDNPEPYLELARTLRELRLTSTAWARLASVADRWPRRWEVHLELARLTESRGEAHVAIDCYERVIQLTRETVWAEPYVGAARQLRRLQRVADAETLLDQAFDLCAGQDFQERLLLTERALVLVAAGSYQLAEKILQELIKTTGDHRTVWDSARLLAEQQEFEAALSLIRSLRSLVHTHSVDTLTYDRYAVFVAGAAKLASEIDRACARDVLLEALPIYPLSGVAEEPAAQLLEVLPNVAYTVRYYHSSGIPPAPPARPEALPPHLDHAARLFPWPAPRTETVHFTYVVPDAYIFDNLGTDPRSLVLDADGAYVEGLVSSRYPAVLGRRAARDRRSISQPGISEAFVLPSIGGLSSYYHALVDILASLEVYLELGLRCPIITPGPLSGLHSEIVRASGIPSSTCTYTSHELNGRRIGRAICPEPARGDLFRKWCSRVVGNVLGTSSEAVPGHVVYVSRRGAPTRKLANELDLESRLIQRFQAEIAHMEDLPFTQQVTLARRASILVGPHGAGLANMAFMQPGSWVVELLPARYAVGVFRILAAELGLGYLAIEGGVRDAGSMEWAVTLDLVEEIVQSLVYSAA
jgi:tetratricopeptide (TPR) repeat protein